MRVNVGELGLQEIYAEYRKKVDDPVEYKLFSLICKQHNREYMYRVIQLGQNMRVPSIPLDNAYDH